jgi:hypothetical protein
LLKGDRALALPYGSRPTAFEIRRFTHAPGQANRNDGIGWSVSVVEDKQNLPAIGYQSPHFDLARPVS